MIDPSHSDQRTGTDDTDVGGPSALRRDLGEVIAGRYRVEALLGIGGMGAVYRTFDEEVRETVALKLLLGASDPADPQVERFRREVRLARRVTHPNAARVYDLGRADDRWFLTMELVEGESLRELLQREGRLDVARACRIAADVGAGLTAIHRAGVLHRDLKPANILLAEAGRVVVTDFGIARTIVGEDTAVTAGVIGTPGYMAPEQAMIGEKVDERADLFALGAMVFVMLSGRHPAEVFARALERGEAGVWPPELATLVEVPAELAELVRRCLQRDPADRPTDAASLERALRSLAKQAASLADGDTQTSESAVCVPVASSQRRLDKQTIAVMPLRFRGRDDDDIAGAITEELVDLLSRTRELWVVGGGATARFGSQADPQQVARELGVDFMVDGTVSRSGTTVRIAVRLIEASSGVQSWAGRVDGQLAELFELQERLARKLAELLRVELLTLAYRRRVSSEAVDLYLRGREKLRGGPEQLPQAVELLDRALAQHRDFAPAAALRALASLRMWFFCAGEHERWGAHARAAVAAALTVADDLAATHEAAGVLALNSGEFSRGVAELEAALAISPTSPFTNAYLGTLRVETGRIDDGRAQLELAHELDPMLAMPMLELARLAAVLDDWPSYRRHVETMHQTGTASLWLPKLELRVACWRGDRATVETKLAELLAFPNTDTHTTALLTGVLRGEGELAELLAQVLDHVDTLGNLRYRAYILQFFSEAACYVGAPERALALVREALDAYLLDVLWLERCPILAPLRALPGYAELHDELRRRARSIWR